MKTHTWFVRSLAGGVLAISTLASAACGSGGSSSSAQPQAQVPTLATSAAVPASATSTAAATGAATTAGTPAGAARPRLTLDMTNTQISALYDRYSQCEARNGYSKQKNVEDQAARTKAENACVGDDPLPPWQLDASNPKAADFVHAVVQCLRDKGVQYVSTSAPEGGQYGISFGGPDNDSQSITLGMQDTPECEKQVAAQGIGS